MKKPLNEILFGDPEKTGIDKYLVNIINFLVLFAAVLATIVNILITLPASVLWASVSLMIISLPVYYLSRFHNYFLFGKFFTTILVIIVLNYFWFFNNASQGPILYLLVAFFSVVVFIFEGRSRFTFIVLLFIDIAAMFVVERHYPQHFMNYPDRNTRLTDVYSGILIYMTLLFILMVAARNFLEKERQKAQRSDSLKSAFLANMSHEIRTPMNAVVGFSQLLEKRHFDDKSQNYVRIIRENSLYLLQLIDDIIDISKIEANQFELIPALFSVDELMGELKVLMQAYLVRIEKPYLNYMEEIPERSQVIFADRTRVKQVLINLLTNAAKFTQAGYIKLGYRFQKKSIIFFVTDTGIGIHPENQAQIFERFVKIDAPTGGKFVQGTGIGLSISLRIAELMGGTLSLDSIPGRGSTFSFSFPLVQDSGLFQERKEEEVPIFDFTGKKILVAEDEDSNYELLFEMLSDYNLIILRAKDGMEAVDFCQKDREIQLVLMDIRMPVMDGLKATIEIHKFRPELPVIAQTAHAMEADHRNCMEAGCTGYISKPINLELLISLIKHNIG